MGLFVCQECKSIENTACGLWWSRNMSMWPPDVVGKALCSACAPKENSDGTATRYGKWHNRFPRKKATRADADRVYNPEEIPP